MFEGKHFEPQLNSEILDKGDKIIVYLCRNISIIIENFSMLYIKDLADVPEGSKKTYKQLNGTIYNLMINATRMDSILEELWSRIYAKKFNSYSSAEGYYEALQKLGCSEKMIDEVKILRNFRNMCCHSISLKKSIISRKDAENYLLTIKPVTRDLYQETVRVFKEAILKNISDEEFDNFLCRIIKKRGKQTTKFKEKSLIDLYGFIEDKKYTCNEDKDKIVKILKNKFLAQKTLKEMETYMFCIDVINEVGCLLEKQNKRSTYNEILIVLSNLTKIAELEYDTNMWGIQDAMEKINKIFEINSPIDVNGRKRLKWSNVYFKFIVKIYENIRNYVAENIFF